VEYINKHGKMNSGDVAAMFKTSRQAESDYPSVLQNRLFYRVFNIFQ